jgi:hypothetical protein
MKWVTRRQIRVNRTATCWLIRRFIDPSAEFIFVEPTDVASIETAQSATGFDAPNATYPHKNEKGLCSFAALVDERFSDNNVLREMARVVQAADFKDQLDAHPAGTRVTVNQSWFSARDKDDHETAARAAFVYDSLYASIESAGAEQQN